MSATSAVQTALVAALDGIAGLTGVYDGPPARAAFPYAAIGAGSSTNWSHKTARGREHRLIVSIWDEAGNSARLQGLAAATEDAIEAMPRDLGEHRLVSLALIRSRIVRDGAGPWAAIIEYRARTLEE